MLFDHVNNVLDVAALHNGEDDLHRAGDTFGIDDGEPVPRRPEEVNEFVSLHPGDDADDHLSDGEPVLNKNAYIVTNGKTGGIGDHAKRVAQVLEDLADGHEPDQHLKEADDGGIVFEMPVDENNADRIQAYVYDAGKKDERRQYQPCVHRRVEECRHSHFPLSSISISSKKDFPLMLPVIECITSCGEWEHLMIYKILQSSAWGDKIIKMLL